jgi:hypothetical protein
MKGGESCPKANKATFLERRSRNRVPCERVEPDTTARQDAGEFPFSAFGLEDHASSSGSFPGAT